MPLSLPGTSETDESKRLYKVVITQRPFGIRVTRKSTGITMWVGYEGDEMNIHDIVHYLKQRSKTAGKCSSYLLMVSADSFLIKSTFLQKLTSSWTSYYPKHPKTINWFDFFNIRCSLVFVSPVTDAIVPFQCYLLSSEQLIKRLKRWWKLHYLWADSNSNWFTVGFSAGTHLCQDLPSQKCLFKCPLVCRHNLSMASVKQNIPPTNTTSTITPGECSPRTNHRV